MRAIVQYAYGCADGFLMAASVEFLMAATGNQVRDASCLRALELGRT